MDLELREVCVPGPAPLEATGMRFHKAISIFNCNFCTSWLPLTTGEGCKLAL